MKDGKNTQYLQNYQATNYQFYLITFCEWYVCSGLFTMCVGVLLLCNRRTTVPLRGVWTALHTGTPSQGAHSQSTRRRNGLLQHGQAIGRSSMSSLALIRQSLGPHIHGCHRTHQPSTQRGQDPVPSRSGRSSPWSRIYCAATCCACAATNCPFRWDVSRTVHERAVIVSARHRWNTSSAVDADSAVSAATTRWCCLTRSPALISGGCSNAVCSGPHLDARSGSSRQIHSQLSSGVIRHRLTAVQHQRAVE